MLDANAAASAVYSPINNKVYVFGGRSSFDTTAVSGATRVYDVATNSWSSGAGMPAPRYQMAAGYYNGKIYLAGGTSTNNSAQTNLWEYDPIANTWNASRLSIPLAAAGSYFGIINGHLYLAGGFQDPFGNGGKILYDYDIAHDSWTRRADLLHNHSVVSSAVADGRLRIIGGFYDTEAGDIGESYDPRSDTWSEEPSFTKQSLAATAIGSTLFAAGGIQYVGMGAFVSNRIARVSTCTKECDTSSWGLKTSYPFAVESPAVGSDGMFAYVAGGLAGGVAINRFFRSDATGDAWIEMPPLPAAVHSGRGVYAPKTQVFYVFGGRNNSNVLNTVYKYSFATNSWNNGAAMPAERYFANVAYSKVTGKIYVIGGFDSSNAETKQTWEYDPLTDSWNTSRSDIPTPMAGSGTMSVGQFIDLVGSWNGGAGSILHRHYNVTTDSWTDEVPLGARPVYNPATVALGGRVYLIGGLPTGDKVTFIYDIGSSTWDVHPSTNVLHGVTNAAAINGRILIVGGDDGAGGAISTVESLAVVCSDCPSLLKETFDEVTPPSLPNDWTAVNAQGAGSLWSTSNTNPDTLNNATVAFDRDQGPVDKLLITPELLLPAAPIQVRFRSAYNLGFYFNNYNYQMGGVLEISSPSVNGGAFSDVTDPLVGGSFLNGGYNGTLSDPTGPFLPRPAWGGFTGEDQSSQPPYVDALVNLGPNIAGPARLRFRVASQNVQPSSFAWHIDNVSVTPLRCPPPLVTAVSRKVHGSAGVFDIDLPLTGTPGVECRTGPVVGEYQIVLTFASSVTFNGVSVTSGSATTSVSNNQVTVNLTGVPDAQTITVTLVSADDGANFGDISVSMKVLPGDTNGNGSVNASDVSQTKGQVGQTVTISNFRTDVNASGLINASDVSFIKSRVGTAVP